MPDTTLIPLPPDTEQEQSEVGPSLTPIDFDAWDYTPGDKASWRCSQHDCYGPDELGFLRGAIDELIQGTERVDAAARIWEVLQAWEQRLFRRNYQFLNAGWKGWGMFGGSSGTTGASILQTQNSMKLFSCNVFGARHKKIVALLSREVPPTEVVAAEENTMDQEAAQESVPYLKAFREQAKLRKRMQDAASYLYTDGSAVFLTYTVADRKYGIEIGDDGQPGPARREEVEVFGKLERKIPLCSDELEDAGWIRLSKERSKPLLKARYPWIKDKIGAGANKDAMGQIDRMARANVRLAVQASSTSGEAYAEDTTESVYFFRPSMYETIADEAQREMLYDNFPSGLEVWTAGGEIGIVRESCLDGADGHVAVCHATPGDGQNRESIGNNYLPIQKVLNATISLYDRYFRAAVPKRFAGEPVIDVEAMNQQSNDPAKAIPVDLQWLVDHQMTIDGVTGIEKVPSPNDAILSYIQWLIQQLPAEMDGGAPAVFGIEADASSKGTFGEARLDRDQALQVFSLPWGEMAMATACFCSQAIKSASQNRQSDFSIGLPDGKVSVSLNKLKGNVLVWPSSSEIPPTLAEQQAEIGAMIQAAPTVPFYAGILADPRNLEFFRKLPSLAGLKIPGLEDVIAQVEDNQNLLSNSPLPNPMIGALQDQIRQIDMQAEQEAAQAMNMEQRQQIIMEAQQKVAQLQQQLTTLPPYVPSIQPSQDASEDHQIRASIALAEMKSPRGRAAKAGDEKQQAGFQNLMLNWQGHAQVAAKLQPPPPIESRISYSVDTSKLPPPAQSEFFERAGLQIPPIALQPVEQEHEITEESTGVDPQTGVPVKRKVSVVGKPLS